MGDCPRGRILEGGKVKKSVLGFFSMLGFFLLLETPHGRGGVGDEVFRRSETHYRARKTFKF